MKYRIVTFIALLAIVLAMNGQNATAQPPYFSQQSQECWVGTWATATQPIPEKFKPKTALSGASLPQTVRVSIGGRSLRLRLAAPQRC